jgi:hypothetical protein
VTDPKAGAAADDLLQAILERRLAANRALRDLELSILKSLRDYSETATKSMDALTQLNLPGEGERQAVERVHEEVLKVTAKLIRDIETFVPRPDSGT